MIPNYEKMIKYGVITMDELKNLSWNNKSNSIIGITFNKIFKNNVPLKGRLYCLYIILYSIFIIVPTIFICFVVAILCYPFYKIYDYIDKNVLR